MVSERVVCRFGSIDNKILMGRRHKIAAMAATVLLHRRQYREAVG